MGEETMRNSKVPGVNRRAFLLVTGAGLAAALGGSTSGATRRPTFDTVDEVMLQVVVDAATFGPFLPDQFLPGLQVRRSGERSAARMSRKSLMAEFGLSILARSRRGTETRQVLVDFGYSPEVLANNIELLGIDPASIDAAVLSHGHLDHYGGFAGLFGDTAGGGRRLPLFVGGEETFCERVAMIGNPPPIMGTLDRADLARAGFMAQIAPEPRNIANHAFTTGIIPLQGFERAAIPTRMRPGVGCDLAGLSAEKRGLAELPDDGEHELATCYAVKDLGLVVIASCSHRGVLNSVRQAQAISGISKVHSVVGGFHLVRPRTEEEARRTVTEFLEIDPTYVVPMHCTGEIFIAEALRRMPDKVIRPYVGNRLVFGPA
jgi:7,8-dihydropterin-6-yl-methyl-4-(beta-D-ribofuranosyl)aminobenzene 5'-phosphate synthase